tara:strand:+ start:344 stop:751 length:408 start_codon:yes stop_codon:yes gene_type:complete
MARSQNWELDRATLSNEAIAAQVSLDKFRMFFGGLIFAIISFTGTNPIHTDILLLKIAEVISLLCLLFAGIILLIRLSGTRYVIHFNEKKEMTCCQNFKSWILDFLFNREVYYWGFFIIGMATIVFNRSFIILNS